jgi:TonB family protein
VSFSNGGSQTNHIGSLPPALQEIVRNCDAQGGLVQWSAADLAGWLSAAQSPSQRARPAIQAPAMRVSPSRARRPKLTSYVILFALILVALATIGSLLSHRTAGSTSAAPQPSSQAPEQAPSASPPTTFPKQRAAAVKATAPVRAAQSQAPVDSHGQVALQVLPDISEKARATIHGTVVVVVRATVNQAGDVTDASLQPTGSRYLGKLAMEAVRKWRFAPGNGPEEWRVRFEMTRTETKVFPQRLPGR